MKHQFLLPAAVALALGSGAIALPSYDAWAQGATTPQPSAPAATSQKPHRDFGARLDQHIDRMKSELKITPAQEPQFNKFAQALRDNAAERQKVFADLRGNRDQNRSAVDRMEAGVKLTQLRVQQDQRSLDAFRPLYASLSADQKQAADKLFAPHHGHGHGRHHA